MRKGVASFKTLMSVCAVVSAGLVGTVVGLATVAHAGGAAPDPTTVSYSSTTDPPPQQIPSAGPEAYVFSELGNEVNLANPGPLSSVVVTMSSLACEMGTWYGGSTETPGHCVTNQGATFSVPITLKIYGVGDGTTPGPVIATDAGVFNIPFRPSASPECDSDAPGRWYEATNNTCHSGFSYNITFSSFTFSNGFSAGQPLPATVIYGIAYNTTHHGYSPLGANCGGELTSTGSCPADSLNIGLSQNITVGTGGTNASLDRLYMAAEAENGMTCDTLDTGPPPPFQSYDIVAESGPNGPGCGWGAYYFPAVIFNSTAPPVTTTTTVPTTTTTAPTTTTTTGPGPTTTSPPTTSTPTTTTPPVHPPNLPPFPPAGLTHPNAAIVTFGADHYVFAGGRAFLASASELAAVQKVDPAKIVPAQPEGTTAPTSVPPRPGVTVFTQPVNGNVTIYVVGADGELHPFATPTQFFRDGYNGALVITIPNLGGLKVGSNAGNTMTALVTKADGAIVNSSGTFFTFAGGRAFGIPTPAALTEIRKTNSAVELQGSVTSADTGAPMADGVVLSVAGPVYITYVGEVYPFKTATQLANTGYGGTPAVPAPHTGGLSVVFPYV
jgi:hypothetical protein